MNKTYDETVNASRKGPELWTATQLINEKISIHQKEISQLETLRDMLPTNPTQDQTHAVLSLLVGFGKYAPSL